MLRHLTSCRRRALSAALAASLLALPLAGRLGAAEEGQAAASGSERQVGEHRLGVRVPVELLPPVVRAAFQSHGGSALASVNRRTDATGEVVYLARIIDTDSSIQILVVSPLGEILAKAPPRHHAAWLASGSGSADWAAEADTTLWAAGWDTSADAFTIEQKPVDLSLWGPPAPREDPASTVRIGPGGQLATGALTH
jgi:hypothetical protein